METVLERERVNYKYVYNTVQRLTTRDLLMVSQIEIDYICNISQQLLVYLKALQYSISESDQLNSTNNTGNIFIGLDQASSIMVDQTQRTNPQHRLYQTHVSRCCGICFHSWTYSSNVQEHMSCRVNTNHRKDLLLLSLGSPHITGHSWYRIAFLTLQSPDKQGLLTLKLPDIGTPYTSKLNYPCCLYTGESNYPH